MSLYDVGYFFTIMNLTLGANTQEEIDQAKGMVVFFCCPKDTPEIRENINGLILQLSRARNYKDVPINSPIRYGYTAKALDGIEVCFMSEECFKGLIENTEEIALGIKNLVALLGEDKTIYHRWPKPALPTEQTPNPTLTVDRDSVFQATRYLDPLAIVGQKFTIADIVATGITDAVVSLDPIGQTTLALESKVDDIRTDINEAKGHFTGEFSHLVQWFASAFHGGLFSDTNPFTAETFFNRFTRTFNSSTLTYITVPIPVPPFSISVPVWSADSPFIERFTKAFFDTSTNPDHNNAWLSKLFGGFLGVGTGVFATINYHLGEIQYGIKHFFNIFAVGTTDEFLNFSQKIKKEWDKPTGSETQLEVLQNSIFQNNPDYLGRGFTLYDWLTMWVKPHDTNWQGNGYVNPATNMKGHEPRTLDIGGLSALDTLIERFSLAFLQTSNTTSILGKIRDILETGLLFSPSLSILTLINNSLQSIHGVLDIDLGWMARSLDEIAAKDCCEGSNTNGSTTVTNPDGSTTTTPRPPTYERIDPNDPESPTDEPYTKPPITPPSASDGVCGFIYYWLNWVADWVEFLFNLLDPLQWLYKLAGYTGILDYLPKSALGGVWLQKIPSSRLRSMITSFFSWAGRHADDINLWKSMLEQIPNLIRAFADDAACGANGQPEPTTDFSAIDTVARLLDFIIENNPLFGEGARWVGQVAILAYDYGLFDIGGGVDLDSYAQYCPCPSYPSGITGQWNLSTGSPNPYTLTQTGNTVTFTNANGTVTGQGTLNGLVLTGTWVNSGNSTNGTFTWTFNQSVTNFAGNAVNSGGTSFGWNGVKI